MLKTRKALALEQMYKLSDLAHNPRYRKWRNRYTELIKQIGMKTQTAIPNDLKITFCRSCYTLFTLEPTPTVRIRIRPKPLPHLVYTCLICGKIRRINISEKREGINKK